MKKRTKILLAKIGLLIALSMGAVWAAFPTVWMLFSSFKTNAEIFSYPPRFITENFSFKAYEAIFKSPEKMRYFFNSYLVATAATLLALFIAIMTGYAFSRYNFKGKKALNSLIISTQSVPPVALLIPYFIMVLALQLYDTYWALILTYTVMTIPYAILMMTGYFNTLPKEMDEAVKIDGGGSFITLWRILVPVSVPGLVSVAIYTFMQAWNEYMFALVLTRTNEMRTVPIGIQMLMGQHAYEWNQMMAMSFLGCLPILILFIIFQRKFIGGMTAGAVKS